MDPLMRSKASLESLLSGGRRLLAFITQEKQSDPSQQKRKTNDANDQPKISQAGWHRYRVSEDIGNNREQPGSSKEAQEC
jgi:hypothetical protein